MGARTPREEGAKGLDTIPVEILAHIVRTLELADLAALSRTCRRLNAGVSSVGLKDYFRRQIRWYSLGTGFYPPFELRVDWSVLRHFGDADTRYRTSDGMPFALRTLHSFAGGKRSGHRGGALSGYLPVVRLARSGLLFLGLGDNLEVSRLTVDGQTKASLVISKPHGAGAPSGDVTDISVEQTGESGACVWTAAFDGTIKRHCIKSDLLLPDTKNFGRVQTIHPASDIEFSAHGGKMVSSLACRMEGDRTTLLSAGFDGMVKHWSVSNETVQLDSELEVSSTSRMLRPWIVRFLGHKSNQIVVGHTASGPLNVTDSLSMLSILPSGELLRTAQVRFHKGAVYAVAPLPAGISGPETTFVSCGFDGSAALFDLRQNPRAPAISWDDWDLCSIYSCAWDGQHKVVVGTGRHSVVRGYDLRSLKRRGKQEPVTSIYAFPRKDSPIYSLEVDLQRWFVGGEGEIGVVEF